MEKTKFAQCALIILVIIGPACAYLLHRDAQCEKSGGMLVRGAVGFVCIDAKERR
jgi:hypothetical protein